MVDAATRPAAQSTLPPGLRLPSWVQTALFAQFRHRLLPAMRRRHGDVFTLRIQPKSRLFVVLANPEHIRTVFTGPANVYHAGEGNAILGPVMGEDSVLLVDEDKHKRTRRLLMPAFHGNALRGYQDMMTDVTKAEVSRWPIGRPVRALDQLNALTLEIILQVVFGVTDQERLARMRPLVRDTIAINPLIMFGWFYPTLQRYNPWRRYQATKQRFDELLYEEIADRRQATDLDTRSDVLSRLLTVPPSEAGTEDGLSDAELRDQLVTLLLAGHETTATALSWTLHELSRRPDQLRAAQRAADENDEDYLSAVVKEALRIRPVIYEVARKLTEPVELGGFRLPAGAVVQPTIGLVQADPANHPQPGDFRPERFLGSQPVANTWIPFGGGVRRCLGAGFSLTESVIVLRELLTRFDVRPDRPRFESTRTRNVTMVPSRGARVTLTARSTSG